MWNFNLPRLWNIKEQLHDLEHKLSASNKVSFRCPTPIVYVLFLKKKLIIRYDIVNHFQRKIICIII